MGVTVRFRTVPNDFPEAAFNLMAAAAAQSRADQYRERARQLFEIAAREGDTKLRGKLLAIAAQYDDLAIVAKANAPATLRLAALDG